MFKTNEINSYRRKLELDGGKGVKQILVQFWGAKIDLLGKPFFSALFGRASILLNNKLQLPNSYRNVKL